MTKPTETDAAQDMERRLLAARRVGVFEPRDDRRTATGVIFSSAAGIMLWLALACVVGAIALILTSSEARGQQLRAVATVAAWHEYNQYYCGGTDNSFHDYGRAIPGVGIGADLTDDVMAAAGVWRNSHGNASAFALADWRPLRWGPASFGLFVGASGGYCRAGNANSVLPLGGATVRVDIDRFAVHVLAIPPTDWKPATVALAVSVGF